MLKFFNNVSVLPQKHCPSTNLESISRLKPLPGHRRVNGIFQTILSSVSITMADTDVILVAARNSGALTTVIIQG